MKKRADALLAALVLLAVPAFGQGWNITLVGTIYQNAEIHHVALQGDYAFLAAGPDGFRVVDVSNPAQMVEVASITEIGIVWFVAMAGDYAFLACGDDVTMVVNIANPEHPFVVGGFRLDGYICLVDANCAYAVSFNGGVKIYDVSVPATPTLISTYGPYLEYLPDLDKSGNLLYVVCCWGCQANWEADSLLVLDVNDPANPTRVSMTCMYSMVSDVDVLGNYAFFTATLDPFQCWDISDPAHPTQIGVLNLTEGLGNLVVLGNFAYVTGSWTMGLGVVDVSDPTLPAITGYYRMLSMPMGIAVNGDYAFIADWDQFEVYDCSDAIHNDVNVTITPLIQPIQIPASGGSFDYYIFAENAGPGNQIVDLWIKAILPGGSVLNPILGPVSVSLDSGTTGWIRHQNVPGRAAAGLYTYIACVGDYPGSIWASDSLQFTKLASGDWGPGAGDWSTTGESMGSTNDGFLIHNSSVIISVRPNPFNPSTAISYQLSADSDVELKVFDIAGRLVATLVDGWRVAGAHDVTFDGSGLPSGIYIYRVTAGAWSEIGKIILLK